MNYTTIKASKPGQPVPKLEKRTSDSKIFWVDCSDLLNLGEMIYGEPVVTNQPEIQVTERTTKLGKYIQFRATGGSTDMPFMDYQLKFLVNTTLNNTLSVPITLKVFSD